MNPQGENKISWTDFTANPVNGLCLHKCPYCYEAQRRKRFHLKDEITFNNDWFDQKQADDFTKKHGRPAKIFVGSTHDILGLWIPDLWINLILNKTVWKFNPHIFQFLTKNPVRYKDFDFPPNCQLGFTIDNKTKYTQIDIDFLKDKLNFKFISFEPLLSDMSGLNLKGINLAIIGAMTGCGKRNIIPKLEWIESIENICKRDGVEIFYKENIKKYLRP